MQLAFSFPVLKGVELDVRMSKDGELWLFHDSFLDGETDGTGCVESRSSDELSKLMYTSIHREKLVNLSTLTLDESKHYFFDLKFINACENKVVDTSLFKQKLMGIWNSNMTLILPSSKFFPTFGTAFKCILSSDDYQVLTNELSTKEWYGAVIRNNNITKEQVNELLSSGKKIFLYDIRSPKGNLEALKKEPSGIITDEVRSAQALLH
jgi:hypothetical protein